ncbi:DNA helicase [Pseudochrobactrum asaccharolyticum]|uniref:DnaB helicase-like protein n=1 Tax=Pseudochrobactrum asaccharolyticum TaxID=354351 RepID=A0A366DCD8_9HYPH|nr:DNA helicase [Pseudochrobactrum asaccharolyticum]RBO87721.1 DnaB helicase-like protein [Pseudochrobactrum asaccharolyticum]
MRLSAPIYQLKRRAKLLSREDNIPLHEAQDRIAREEGFTTWSLLSTRLAMSKLDISLLPRLEEGDMLLLGARPGHGKTKLGLQLLLDAAREGRRTVFFTLEYTEREAMERIRSLDDEVPANTPEVVTSDEISADFIVQHLSGAPRGTVAVIDYLQILDQQRSKPSLSNQMKVLQAFAHSSGVILGFISQIDRSFDPERAPVPGLIDIRLPNPIPAGIFSKACFLHAGEVRIQHIG